MRIALATCFVLCGVLLTACAPAANIPQSTPTAESSAPRASVSIEDALQELVDHAGAKDTAYFQRLMPGANSLSLNGMIAVVEASNMLAEYESRMRSTPDGAQLDFHSRGSFQVELTERDGDWSVTRLAF